MSKILITSGCSFSQCVETIEHYTWPTHLHNLLKPLGYTHISSAMGSQGNGLISRGIIYNVIKALETYNPEDILVGVMWSSSSRMDYRCDHPESLSWGNQNTNGWVENPTGFVENADKNWVILNHGWTTEEAVTYYKYFHDFVGCTIYSIEHILRTQYFLKSKNIKYFFTNFTDNNIIPDLLYVEQNKHEYQYLYDQIDFNNYLPVSSEHRWVYENSETKEDFIKKHLYNGATSLWTHPRSYEHKEFVDKIIYPYLKNKNII